MRLKEFVFSTGLWNRFAKKQREARYWEENIEKMIRWYTGEEKFYFPFPTEEEKETRFDLKKNAVLTYIRANLRNASYLSDLRLDSDAFAGKRVADIGSGPLPTLMVFRDCERYCVDPLIDTYRRHGYPMEAFVDEVNFISATAEDLPVPEDYFDVVISVNALDHVDNFEKTAGEVNRVLKPDGLLHILVNYHRPTQTETQALNDERILRQFEARGIRKLYERMGAWGFKDGKSVLWSNLPAEMLEEVEEDADAGER